MHITVATIVRNEAEKFLPSALEAWGQFADRIVALDDGSTDRTVELLLVAGAEVHQQDPSMFRADPSGFAPYGNPMLIADEWRSRQKLWHLATHGAEWVIWLDADQVLSCDPRPFLRAHFHPYFRVFDLWSENEYREDAWWTGHLSAWWGGVYVPSLPPKFEDRWNERGVHCGHVPTNLPGPSYAMPLECSILHYGYSTPELREQKAARYEGLATNLSPKERFHARSILMPAKTKPLPFEPTWRLRLTSSVQL